MTAIFEDREGDLWLGGGSGIERLHDTPFTTYSRAHGLPSDGVGAIHVDRLDRVWFSPPEGGLYWLEHERVERVAAFGLENDRVYSIAAARDGLWIGRQRGGLTHLRFEGGTLGARSYNEVDGLSQSSVYAVHESRDGSVWAGTLNGGLCRLREDRIETFTTDDGLPSNSVNALAETADGTLWVGTPQGLAARSAAAWTTRRTADGLPSDSVNALVEDSQGVLWIGTAEGLAFLRSGRVEALGHAPAPLREAIVGLGESEGGWLWIATARRVMRVRREPLLLQATLGEADVVSYGHADGLLGLEGVRRHRSVVADARGRIWISTNRGLSVVHPRRAVAVRAPPLVHIRSLLADDNPIDLAGSLRVPPSPERVRIAYAGVSLQAPERVRFRHRLDGFEARWSEPVSTQDVVFANLAPGPYQFRVTASGPDGLWNGPEAVVAFTIAPALWQTLWFRLAAVLAVALAGWLFYAWRLGQATRRLNLAFEERLAERTRIARELHDTLLQGFVSASMQLHVAVEQVPEASPARSVLSSAQKLMGQVIEEGRNAVQGLRSEGREMGDLAQALSRVSEELGLRRAGRASRDRRRCAAPAAPDGARRALPDRPRGAAERHPPRAGPADRGRAGVRSTCLAAPGSRRRHRRGPRGPARRARRALRALGHSRARRAPRRTPAAVERAGSGHGNRGRGAKLGGVRVAACQAALGLAGEARANPAFRAPGVARTGKGERRWRPNRRGSGC